MSGHLAYREAAVRFPEGLTFFANVIAECVLHSV